MRKVVSAGPRNDAVGIVLTPDEHDIIRLTAALSRQSMSAYSREFVLKAARRDVENLRMKRERLRLEE